MWSGRSGAIRRSFAVAFGIVISSSCLGPTVGQVDLPALDKAVDKKLVLPAGKQLSFAVHADRYDHSGSNYVVIDVTLLKDGKSVQTMSCRGFELEGGAGCGSGATHAYSDCAMTVPAGGSDAIRVIATLEDKANRASFDGLSVYVRD